MTASEKRREASRAVAALLPGGITLGISGEPLTQLSMKATLCGESAACRCYAAEKSLYL
jgi:hypothetical protein